MVNSNNKLFFVFIACLLLMTNSFALDNSKTGIKMLNNINAPDTVIFFNEKSEKFSLDQFEGKTILLVFWATWCATCVKEMPDLDVLQKDFRKLPFEIVPISEDYHGVKAVQEYFKSYGIRYLPIYHDYKNQLFKALTIVGLPTSILITPDGKMVVSFIGNINWYDDKVRNIILSHIPGNHPEPKNSYQGQSLNQPAKPLSLRTATTGFDEGKPKGNNDNNCSNLPA